MANNFPSGPKRPADSLLPTPTISPVLRTIGHSTRPIDEFFELLRTPDIQVLAEVRIIPYFRHNPKFLQKLWLKVLQMRESSIGTCQPWVAGGEAIRFFDQQIEIRRYRRV